MNYSEPSQILVDEHNVIISVIEAVETVAQKPDGETFPAEFFEKACDFFATFADKCHHAKEETHLFPMLEARGIPRQGGPIGCMISEHDEGRSHIAAIRRALQAVKQGDQSGRAVAKQEAMQFCGLLRAHIDKENQVLFVVGDQVMSDEDKELLTKRFNCAEHESLPPGSHDRYIGIARELREYAGLGGGIPAHSCCHATVTHACHASC